MPSGWKCFSSMPARLLKLTPYSALLGVSEPMPFLSQAMPSSPVAACSSLPEIDAIFGALGVSEPMPFLSQAMPSSPVAACSSLRWRHATGSLLFSARDMVQAGLLMSYGTNFSEMFRQVGIYTGSVLKGANVQTFR